MDLEACSPKLLHWTVAGMNQSGDKDVPSTRQGGGRALYQAHNSARAGGRPSNMPCRLHPTGRDLDGRRSAFDSNFVAEQANAPVLGRQLRAAGNHTLLQLRGTPCQPVQRFTATCPLLPCWCCTAGSVRFAACQEVRGGGRAPVGSLPACCLFVGVRVTFARPLSCFLLRLEMECAHGKAAAAWKQERLKAAARPAAAAAAGGEREREAAIGNVRRAI